MREETWAPTPRRTDSGLPATASSAHGASLALVWPLRRRHRRDAQRIARRIAHVTMRAISYAISPETIGERHGARRGSESAESSSNARRAGVAANESRPAFHSTSARERSRRQRLGAGRRSVGGADFPGMRSTACASASASCRGSGSSGSRSRNQLVRGSVADIPRSRTAHIRMFTAHSRAWRRVGRIAVQNSSTPTTQTRR